MQEGSHRFLREIGAIININQGRRFVMLEPQHPLCQNE